MNTDTREVPKLDGKLVHEGAFLSGGKSFNVWVEVAFPKDLLADMIDHLKTKTYEYDTHTGEPNLVTNKKLCVWTAFDDYIYQLIHEHDADHLTPDELIELIYPQIPKISATFKSCFDDYAAVTENIGYQIASALDMPTSYNYIVNFDTREYPQIIANYPNPLMVQKLKPYGIVSIDFLQQKPGPLKVGVAEYKGKEIPSISQTEGDSLISFEDAFNRYNLHVGSKLDGKANLIENWLDAADEVARRELLGCPRERVNKEIAHVHSRIARSFLLREFIGDCDFTAYNGGVVVNQSTKRLRYAPNYDFGEAFNSLLKGILKVKDDKPTEEQEFKEKGTICGLKPAIFNSLPEATREKLRKQMYSTTEASIEEVATAWASGTSEENFYYIMENFPESADEFFVNLDVIVMKGDIEHIIDSYEGLTCNGTELLNEEERQLFKEYLYERASYLSSLFVRWRQEHNMPIPESLDYERSVFYE